MGKRFLSLLLCLVMLASALPVSANGAIPHKKTGTFYYASEEMQDYPATYYYDDGYFAQSGYTYQDSLSTMSLCLAMSGFNSYRTPLTEAGYSEKSRNLQELLSGCGFPASHFSANTFYQIRPTADSVGVAASYKTIAVDGEPCTLLAVCVRGGNYEIEWASNFTLGTEGEHQGFLDARDQVLAFLTDYVSAQKLSGRIKLWITGYSRGAVTANMTAAALDGGYSLGDAVQLAPEDLYAYCFECPQGTVDPNRNGAVYGNIFNIINPTDLVTKLAPTSPAQFGFGRYGVDRFLPTVRTHGDQYAALRDAMLQHYNALSSTKNYVVDDFQMKRLDVSSLFDEGLIVNDTDPRWDQSAFVDEFYNQFFGDLIQNRANYVANYQDDFRTMSCILFRSEKQTEVFGEKLTEHLTDQILGIAVCLVLNQEDQLTDIMKDVVLAAMDDAGMTGYSDQEVEDLTRVLVKLLLAFGRENPDLTVTLISNLDGLISAHYPELCFAWLRSFDPNYTPEGSASFAAGVDGIYRVSGGNRYETALEAADALKQLQVTETFDTIVIASGSQFPDALAGSYLANRKQAPILLVNRHTVNQVADYVSANLAPEGTVYLLGGEAAVPAEMEEALSGFQVQRLSGSNRYETNLEILNEAGITDQEILICTGKSFADSLSASAVGRPILLVNKSLTQAQKEWLRQSSGKFVIIGGESAVSAQLAKELSAWGSVERIGGANRYETSVLVARRFFSQPRSLVLAYAKNFPDGLSGGPLAYRIGGPLILTATGKEAAAAQYAVANGITTGIVMGGAGLISPDSVNLILNP